MPIHLKLEQKVATLFAQTLIANGVESFGTKRCLMHRNRRAAELAFKAGTSADLEPLLRPVAVGNRAVFSIGAFGELLTNG